MARSFVFLLALALYSCTQAEHVKVPLKLHHGKQHNQAHVNSNIAKHKRSGGVTIEPEVFASNKFWYGSFDVGDTKNLSLAIDTGSSYLIVNPGLYKPSSSAINLNRTGGAAYIGTLPNGCGSLNVTFSKYADTVSVQGLSAKNQHLGDTHKFPTPRPQEIDALPPPFQGIVGLSDQHLLPIAGTGGLAFFANLCNQSAVAECRFGTALGTAGKGEQIFGGIDDSLFEGSLSRSPLIKKEEWLIKGGFASGGNVLSMNQSFILDTGTPNVIGPMGHVRTLFERNNISMEVLEEPGCFSPRVLFGKYKCSAPPEIGFTVGGKVFNIEGSSFALHSNATGYCTATLVGVEEKVFGPNGWLIGQAWMQGKYIDWDQQGNSVAMATLKDTSGAK